MQITETGFILPRWGLVLPRIPPPSTVLYSAVTHTFLGYIRTQNTPHPTPTHPFSWPELKSGQNERLSGQVGPNWALWAKYLKSGQNFVGRSGQKEIIHVRRVCLQTDRESDCAILHASD